MLKNTLKLAFASILFLTSCSNDDNAAIVTTDDDKKDTTAMVTVNATNGNTDERKAEIIATPATTVPVIVKFTKENKAMNRLYVTQALSNSKEGAVPYNIDSTGDLGLKLKGDESLDLEGDQEDEFTFTINFPAPAVLNETVQYVIWATNQRGDFRDITNDNSYEDKTTHAVITITAGTAAEVTGYREFEQTISLEVPSADGKSETFISVFNGQKYKINDGVETAALWDFGYFYGATSKASLYSSYAYSNSSFLHFFGTGANQSVAQFAGVDEATDLNKFYFSKSTMDFDGVSKSSDLDGIVASTDQSISGLSVGDVVEFVDQYGNKGLLKITAIVESFNAGSTITFYVKSQGKPTPIKG